MRHRGRGSESAGNQAQVAIPPPASIDCVNWGMLPKLSFLINKADAIRDAQSWLLLAPKSQLCVFLFNSSFSHMKLVSLKRATAEYFHQRNEQTCGSGLGSPEGQLLAFPRSSLGTILTLQD